MLAQQAIATRMLTTREQYRITTEVDGCISCHGEDINPLGFAMEDFDGLGRHRSQQVAIGTDVDGMGTVLVDIDAEGALWDPETENFTNHDVSIPVTGAREVSLAMANTQSIHGCLVEKAFRYAVSRPINTGARDPFKDDADYELSNLEADSFACAKETLENTLRVNNHSPRAMIKALGAMDLMRFRK